MVARLAVLAVAAVVAVVAAGRIGDARACSSARSALIGALFHRATPAGGFDARVAELRRCRDPQVLGYVSTIFTTAGDRRRALALAREAVRREPKGLYGWAAMAQALAVSDPRGAQAALDRARALDPRARIPRALGAGAPARRP